MVETDRLDILIYGHDGRGLGHASRSIAVGMALRRLYPALKVLFVSGCNFSQELIGAAPLDWLKLPSYATRVIDGTSHGVTGRSMFQDRQLGEFRAREMAHLVSLYRPRLVLVDHTPQGKHKELVPALRQSENSDTAWVLGVRGVVGTVRQAGSDLARELFKRYFHALLWYGDSAVLGESHRALLARQYGIVPRECGYVLRLAEMATWSSPEPGFGRKPAGIVSVPWLGERSLFFLTELAAALKNISPDLGDWHLYIGTDDSPTMKERLAELFSEVPHCRLERPGPGYVASLLQSRVAVVYGGYNSLMDVLHAGVPALVAFREMQDGEQQIHLQRLQETAGDSLTAFPESLVTSAELERLLVETLRQRRPSPRININMEGASCAARHLAGLLAGNA